MPSSDPSASGDIPQNEPTAPAPVKSEPEVQQKGKGKGAGEKSVRIQEPSAPAGEKKLTGAELKAKAKAEKAARRAQAAAEKQGGVVANTTMQSGPAQKSQPQGAVK